MEKRTNLKLGTIPLLILLLWGFILVFSMHLQGATFTVNTTADTVDANPGDGTAADADGNCSLRAAIMEANALAGEDTINIPVGTYKLTIVGAEENHCAAGDLDIRSHLTIQAAGMDNTIIDGNQLDRVFHVKGAYKVNISDMTIRNGKTPDGKNATASPGGHGGGILNYKGTLTIKHCKISENVTGKGGYNWVAYVGGDGGDGGGLCNLEGTVVLNDSLISQNTTGDGGFSDYAGSGGYGGGISNNEGSLTLEYCDILENRCGNGGGYYSGSGGYGGGISNSLGTLLVRYCTIRSNNAGDCVDDCGGGSGGGIFNRVTGTSAKIYYSLIADNTSGFNIEPDIVGGGGIFNWGTLSIFNSTISGNYTKEFGTSGGGIANIGTLILESCTITENTADDSGGGICNGDPYYPQDEKTKIHNTIIASNTAWSGTDCSGQITSRGYNMIEDTSGCTIKGDETGNIYGEDPKLGPLKNNGGPTLTQELKNGSPAIDAGDFDDYEETDQRGVFRPKDGNNDGTPQPDMGAFEKFAPQVTIISPSAGATVCGTIEIEAEANTKYVDFYIDNKLLHTDDSEPFSCTWDTTTYSNGRHTIKAKGYDTSDGFSAWDSVKVRVNNTIISLHASRQDESSWLIKRQYGKITFTITNTGSANPAKYVIERKEANGSFNSIAEIPASQVQGSSYTYNDCYLNKNINYTYRVTAYNNEGVRVGQSSEKTI